MEKFKVVVTDHVYPSLDLEREKLKEINAELIEATGKTEKEIIEAARDSDAILVCYAEITKNVIDSLEKCKIIARSGIGVNNVDVEAATKRGIRVTNVPDYCVDEVSDHALALILALARNIIKLNNNVKSKRWSFNNCKPMYRLKGKVLGLIGFGRIARNLAEKAKAIGFKIITSDPFIGEKAAKDYGVELVGLKELLRESDFISLHAPLTPETHKMIGINELKMMKKTAFIVNTSRGGLIDEEALYKALTEKWISGAALDVLSSEIFDPSNPLIGLDNVILTPHAAFYSEESLKELREKTVDEIIRALTGRPSRNLVNKEVCAEKEDKHE